MDKPTPQTEIESISCSSTNNNSSTQSNCNTIIQQFLELLKSSSGIIQFEAASSLSHILNNSESAVEG